MVDFKTARSPLNISKSQFNELDALDGKKDGEISEDIFTKAKEMRKSEQAGATETSQNSDSNDKDIYNKIKEILAKGITTWLRPAPGNEAYTTKFYDSCIIKDDGSPTLNTPDRKLLEQIGVDLAKYVVKNGTTEGFETKGVPARIDISSFEFEYLYPIGENDSVSQDNNKIHTKKVADAINVRINFEYNGKRMQFVSKSFLIKDDKYTNGVPKERPDPWY